MLFKFGLDFNNSEVHSAISASPTLDSKAEVVHQPIERLSARVIQDSADFKPPKRLGFNTKYAGRIFSSRALFSDLERICINSSSRAIGTGEEAQSSAISSIKPGDIGCSILCRSSPALYRICSFASAVRPSGD